ncbi:hypothetical protein WJX74_001814 [Apatococcus lobatus]|uniref:Uncharacterized protein n=1 Tax=Apatococcus lobatus TaxID=904363 RepID=A0AAW1QXS5_9CHLO
MHLIQRHQAEVERALPRISIGKAAGKAGWAAELLWHASYHVQLEDGRRVHAYADDVELLSWRTVGHLGHQTLLDGMHSFCQA